MSYPFLAQFITYAEGAQAFELLRYQGAPMLSGPSASYRVTCEAGSRKLAVRASTLDGLIGKLAERNMNEIWVKHGVTLPMTLPFGATLTDIQTVMDISPVNALWHSVSDVQTLELSKGARNTVRTFSNREEGLKRIGMKRYPTIYATTAMYLRQPSFDEQRVIDGFYEAIASLGLSFPFTATLDLKSLAPSPLMPIQYVLAPQPKVVWQQLDAGFDDLHRVLIGPTAVCEPLAHALKGGAALRPLPAAGDVPMAFLIVSEDVVRDYKSREAALKWIVPIEQ